MNNFDKSACKTNDEIDRISSLPDEMLEHILSFLGIQEAVQTSLVSKRWLNLWTTLSRLNFNPVDIGSEDESLNFEDRIRAFNARYEKFVETLLSCRKPCSLDTFMIEIYDEDNCFDLVHTCVSYAMKFNPRVFSMESFCYNDIYACIFSCVSIEQLCLIPSFNYDYLEIPEVVNLPFIRRLQLGHARLDNRCITILFSGCPKLEELLLEYCICDFSCIFSHKLKYLSLLSCISKLPPKNETLCITTLSLHEDTVEANINYLSSTTKFILKTPGVSVQNNPSSFMKNFICRVVLDDILPCLSGVPMLKLHSRNFKILEKDLPKLGKFHCLTELSLSGWCMTCNFRPVALILEKSPDIQKLTLYNSEQHCRGEKIGVDQVVDDSMLLEFSQCKNLKVVHIKLGMNNIISHRIEEAFAPTHKRF